MTFKGIAILLILCHVTGDFYLQRQKLSELKEQSYKHTVIHGFLYAIPFLVVWLAGAIFFALNNIWSIFVLIVFSHLLVDIIKCCCMKKKFKVYFAHLYIIDQILHIAIIFAAAYFLIPYVSKIEFNEVILSYILFFVIILKPVNITLHTVYSKFQPTETEDKKTESIPGAGAVIGNLERTLIGLLLILGQYSSIGLVLTAKSIARFDRIAKEPMFAENYLIGTLFSVLSTLIFYLLIFKI